MRRPEARSEIDDRVLVALRKSAVMTHWVPDLGVTLTQVGRPAIRVATWGRSTAPMWSSVLEIHPCEFRRFVVQLLDVRTVGLASIIAFDGHFDLDVDYFIPPYASPTRLGPQGMMRHELDDELGVSLVHTTFAASDAGADEWVVEAMFDIAVMCGAEEVATMMGRS